MLGKDTNWYMENADRIVAFRKYVRLLETDIVPESIGKFVTRHLRDAIDGLSEQEVLYMDSEGANCAWWYLADGIEDENTFVGAWMEYWVPGDSIEWLYGHADERPYCSICTYGGSGPKGKARSAQLGEAVKKSCKLPKGFRWEKAFDDDYLYVATCYLDNLITKESLVDSARLGSDLEKFFQQATLAFLPGLKRVRDAIR